MHDPPDIQRVGDARAASVALKSGNDLMPTGKLIHVVDDDRGFLKGIERLLSAHGLEVRTFSSAEEFQAEADLDEAACLILDIHLTGMSGIELLSRLTRWGSEDPGRSRDRQRQRSDPASGNGSRLRCLPSEAVLLERVDGGTRRSRRARSRVPRLTGLPATVTYLPQGAVHLNNRAE